MSNRVAHVEIGKNSDHNASRWSESPMVLEVVRFAVRDGPVWSKNSSLHVNGCGVGN
jgi:hypothetical protein